MTARIGLTSNWTSVSSTCLQTDQFIVGQISSNRSRYCARCIAIRCLRFHKCYTVALGRTIVQLHARNRIFVNELRNSSMRRHRMAYFPPEVSIEPMLQPSNAPGIGEYRSIALDVAYAAG